jgi:Transcription factor TFIIB repeat
MATLLSVWLSKANRRSLAKALPSFLSCCNSILRCSRECSLFKISSRFSSLLDPMKCIAKVANKANLSEKTKRQASQIMDNVSKREASLGKNPMGLAASVLYISSLKNGENITQYHLSNAIQVLFLFFSCCCNLFRLTISLSISSCFISSPLRPGVFPC